MECSDMSTRERIGKRDVLQLLSRRGRVVVDILGSRYRPQALQSESSHAAEDSCAQSTQGLTVKYEPPRPIFSQPAPSSESKLNTTLWQPPPYNPSLPLTLQDYPPLCLREHIYNYHGHEELLSSKRHNSPSTVSAPTNFCKAPQSSNPLHAQIRFADFQNTSLRIPPSRLSTKC